MIQEMIPRLTLRYEPDVQEPYSVQALHLWLRFKHSSEKSHQHLKRGCGNRAMIHFSSACICFSERNKISECFAKHVEWSSNTQKVYRPILTDKVDFLSFLSDFLKTQDLKPGNDDTLRLRTASHEQCTRLAQEVCTHS